MPAAHYDLECEQGAKFNLAITWEDPAGTPINLTGYRIRMHWRSQVASSTPLLSFDSGALLSGQTIGSLGSTGVIDITLADEITSAFTFSSALYDVTAESAAGVVDRVLEGRVTLKLAVTR